MTITLLAGISLLAAHSALAQAEQPQQPPQIVKEPNAVESTSCPDAQKFIYGGGVSKFAFCITDHGNIQDLVFPAKFKHVSSREGYAVCSEMDTVTHGFDAGAVESGWGPATATQPGGPHTFPLTIIRDSIDGKVRLKQSFDWDTTRKEIIVTMVLKNLSAAPLTGVHLSRYFDGDIDNDSPDDLYDSNGDAVWARDDGFIGRGLRLSALSYATERFTFVEDYGKWDPNGAGTQTARHCFVNNSVTVPTALGDFVGRLTYELGTINAGQSKTVKLLYGRL
jgi:hypothetical protein